MSEVFDDITRHYAQCPNLPGYEREGWAALLDADEDLREGLDEASAAVGTLIAIIKSEPDLARLYSHTIKSAQQRLDDWHRLLKETL